MHDNYKLPPLWNPEPIKLVFVEQPDSDEDEERHRIPRSHPGGEGRRDGAHHRAARSRCGRRVTNAHSHSPAHGDQGAAQSRHLSPRRLQQSRRRPDRREAHDTSSRSTSPACSPPACARAIRRARCSSSAGPATARPSPCWSTASRLGVDVLLTAGADYSGSLEGAPLEVLNAAFSWMKWKSAQTKRPIALHDRRHRRLDGRRKRRPRANRQHQSLGRQAASHLQLPRPIHGRQAATPFRCCGPPTPPPISARRSSVTAACASTITTSTGSTKARHGGSASSSRLPTDERRALR